MDLTAMLQTLLQHKCLVLSILAASLFTIYLTSKTPKHTRDWVETQTTLPNITLLESQFTIAGIRDFRYSSTSDIISKQYLTESYLFSDLTTVWFGLSHFGGHGLAHAFLSFEFTDKRYLVLSIEARLEQGESYSPLRGLLRNYEKIVVFGTEADVIGLRTRSRQEKLLLYPLLLDDNFKKTLLTHYLQQAHALEKRPAFYNTVLDNCMTGILSASDKFTTWDYLTNTSIIFPGRSDQLAQTLGLLDQATPLNQLRITALVDPSQSNPNNADFSTQIRSNYVALKTD